MTSRTLLLLVVLALGAAACGDDGATGGTAPETGPSPDSTTPLAAPEEAELLLEVRDEGGFVPVEWNLSRIPRYVVMTDGRILSPGPVTLEYPGRAVPNIRVTQVEAAALDGLRDIAHDMGLPDITDEHNQEAMATIADAPDTFVTYHDGDGPHTYGVYALGMPEAATDDPRADQLEDLVAELDRLVAEGTDAGAYQPERIEMFAQPAQGSADPEFANVADWPADVGYADMEEGPVEYRCALLEGDAAAGFWAAMEEANQATTFEADGTEYQVIAHPLFPHEEPTC